MPGTRNQSSGCARAQFGHLGGIGGADHQHQISMPCSSALLRARRPAGTAAGRRQQVLEIAGAGIRGAAQQYRAAIGARQKRQHRVLAHVGIDRHRIGAVAIERLARIGLGRVADVVALGVEDDERLRVRGRGCSDARGEFGFGADRAVERDLRLVGRRDAAVASTMRRLNARSGWARPARSAGNLADRDPGRRRPGCCGEPGLDPGVRRSSCGMRHDTSGARLGSMLEG
jgi:hypothetical protein